jgi:DNA-binding MarR family transcriptional regulator
VGRAATGVGRAATANVLGALALAVAGEMPVTVTPAARRPETVGRSGSAAGSAAGSPGARSDSAAATLSALYHFPGDLTVDRLGQVVGLTHSGAVRLVDRLSDAGLVARAPGTDRRSRSVHLTAAGRRAARRVSDGRIAYLTSLLADLSPAEAGTLHDLLGRVMGRVVRHKDGGAWICRMCDLAACGRPTGDCPAANAAALKYGPAPAHDATSRPSR